MKQNDFYEVDGCTDFIPVKLIEEHRHITNTLEVELTQTGCRAFVPITYSFPKVNEPQKPVVPNFVAEYIEKCRRCNLNLQMTLYRLDDDTKIGDWAYDENDDLISEKVDMIARAWLDGYEIEQEVLYTVEIPNPNIIGNEHTVLMKNIFKQIVIRSTYGDNWKTGIGYRLTESEIKQDFEWAWQWAKEVEEK